MLRIIPALLCNCYTFAIWATNDHEMLFRVNFVALYGISCLSKVYLVLIKITVNKGHLATEVLNCSKLPWTSTAENGIKNDAVAMYGIP